MDSRRLKKLAGLLEDVEGTNFSIGAHFGISDPANMHKAVDALLEAGIELDMNYSMGVYYFNFKNEDLASESHKIVAKVIDQKKEKEFK